MHIGISAYCTATNINVIIGVHSVCKTYHEIAGS